RVRAQGSISRIVISKELPILFLEKPPQYLKAVKFIAKKTRTSLPLQLLKTLLTDLFFGIAHLQQVKELLRFILVAPGEILLKQYLLTPKWEVIFCQKV